MHFILIFFVLFACTNASDDRDDFSIDPNAIDSLFIDYNHANVPGANVLIIKAGGILLSKNYGLANLEENLQVEASTNFRLASITKQFTAMCIMILNNHRKLSYTDNLSTFFSEFPSYGTSITVEYLLHHTSGLISYYNLIPDTATQQLKDRDILEMMMRQDSTYFVPGTEYRYSNTGYALLAMIVETVSGESFATFLKENIFDPLQMSGSVAFEEGISTVTNRAYGYSADQNGFYRDDQSLTSTVLGDGGIYTSMNDLYKWDQSLYNGTLVPLDIIEEMFVSGTVANGELTDYGFGWVSDTYRGKKRTYHTGTTIGFRNVYQRFPDERVSIIILTNRNSGSPKEIANEIADIIFGDN